MFLLINRLLYCRKWGAGADCLYPPGLISTIYVTLHDVLTKCCLYDTGKSGARVTMDQDGTADFALQIVDMRWNSSSDRVNSKCSSVIAQAFFLSHSQLCRCGVQGQGTCLMTWGLVSGNALFPQIRCFSSLCLWCMNKNRRKRLFNETQYNAMQNAMQYVTLSHVMVCSRRRSFW